MLRVLHDHQPLTLSALGRLLICETSASPSRLVDRLVAQGLIDRTTDPDDRRFVTLTLTAKGRALEHEIAAAEDRLHDTLERLTTGQPVEETLRLLRGIASAFPAGEALARRKSGASTCPGGPQAASSARPAGPEARSAEAANRAAEANANPTR